MTPEEMIKKGMSLNSAGFWVTESMPINKFKQLKENDESKKN